MAELSFHPELQKQLGCYVYRLIDPRNNKTFYVGKGTGNRVFDHIKEQLKFDESKGDDVVREDDVSTKMQQIRDIHATGMEVITIIHRRGLSNEEALIVEAALIDAYPDLTNIQGGYKSEEQGMISTDDLISQFNLKEYEEPSDLDYVIIKTSEKYKEINKTLYDATRKAWIADFNRVKKYKYALSVINGIVKKVYEVEKWKKSRVKGRVEFIGHEANEKISKLFEGKLIPAKYRTKGLASPFLYKR